jgi:hypothetical protein
MRMTPAAASAASMNSPRLARHRRTSFPGIIEPETAWMIMAEDRFGQVLEQTGEEQDRHDHEHRGHAERQRRLRTGLLRNRRLGQAAAGRETLQTTEARFPAP